MSAVVIALFITAASVHSQERPVRSVASDTAFALEVGGALALYAIPFTIGYAALTSDDSEVLTGFAAMAAASAPAMWMLGAAGTGSALGGDASWFGTLLGGFIGVIGALVVNVALIGACDLAEEDRCFEQTVPHALAFSSVLLLPPTFAAIAYEANNEVPSP